MNYDFSYESNDGTVVEFGSGAFFPEDDAFRSMKYSLKKANNRIHGFYREITEFDIPVTVHTDSVVEAVEECNRLARIGALDRQNLTPGTIRCGSYWTKGYVTAVSFEPADDVYGYLTNAKISVVLEDPTWVTEETRTFLKETYSRESHDGKWLDFPQEYPFDYLPIDRSWQSIENSMFAPCSIRITIFGFAENPSVRVGSNTYKVDCTVAEGSRLVIDSRNREIYEITRLGGKINHLDDRERGSKGGGSYVFEQIPVGRQLVTYDGSFGFDLTMIHEVDMPPFYVKEG